jgi:hypothetical protein
MGRRALLIFVINRCFQWIYYYYTSSDHCSLMDIQKFQNIIQVLVLEQKYYNLIAIELWLFKKKQ